MRRVSHALGAGGARTPSFSAATTVSNRTISSSSAFERRNAILHALDRREERRKPVRRRQHRLAERIAPARRRDRRDLAECVLAHIEGDAAVADAVLVPALVAGAVGSEQQRARIEQVGGPAGTIAEDARKHRRDAVAVVPFLVRPVAGAGAADDLADAPGLAAGDPAHGRLRGGGLFGWAWRSESLRSHGSTIAIFPKPAEARPLRVRSKSRRVRHCGSARRAGEAIEPFDRPDCFVPSLRSGSSNDGSVRRERKRKHVRPYLHWRSRHRAIEGVLRRGARAARLSLPERRRATRSATARRRWASGSARRAPRSPTIRSRGCTSVSSRPTASSVARFHAAALAAGGRDNGQPGVREDYAPDYFAAFVVDPDGYRLEALRQGA